MSDRYGSYPPDEPIIGASYPPRQSSTPTQDEPLIGGPSGYDEEWDDEYQDDYDDGYEDPYYDDYDGEAPARQPMFYVFIGIAALIGGIIIFLLYTLFNGGGGTGDVAASSFKIFIDSPTPNQRIEVGATQDVNVRATASEAITKFELFAGGQSVDSLSVTQPPAADGTYSATLRLPAFAQKGNQTVKVRVTGASGASKDSDPVTVVVIEPVGAKPQLIKGKVLADAITRLGPADSFDAGQTLRAGTEVDILGKTRDGGWLLIDIDGGVWVKATAISAEDSLSLVPVKEPTPVPEPTQSATAVPTPSPSVSPTANAKSPDFRPENATVSNGQVHITISNSTVNSYTGPLVVSVSGLTDTPMVQVFNVNIPANGSAIVDFEVNIDSPKAAAVKVDPDNAVKEVNEDNNAATFQLKPSEETPALTVSATKEGGSLTVVISNSGGPLAAPSAKIRVTLGGDTNEKTVALAIIKGGSQTITGVTAPSGTGTATIEVVVSGTTLATTTLDIQ